ncbi:MAG: DUF1156 domain-containing protein, partial [Sulfolobaceae archaeon]
MFCNNVFPGKGNKWYVKEAIKEWNKNYERFLNGEISLDELRNSKARPRLLVKFRGESKAIILEEITQEEERKFWVSFEKLREIDISKIPTEKIAPYDVLRVTTWGTDKFFKIFNARQLIIFSRIIENLNKLKENIHENEAYKKAIITYLAIAFLNHVRYNCLVTRVDPSRKFVADALNVRRLSTTWNWIEISPLAHVIGSLYKTLAYVIKGLEYLIQINNDSKVDIINVDVNDLNLNDKVDLIITDPPYADDVPYPEESDFYYIWLKRILQLPFNTQWEELVPMDIGVEKGRAKVFSNSVGTYDYFRGKLAQAFTKLSNQLKEDGLLITFYNHTSSDAWISLLYASWYSSKFRITTTYAVTTEDKTRMTAHNAIVSLDKSMVIVWRKDVEGQKLVQEIKREAISTVSDWISTILSRGKLRLSLDTYIEILGKVLSVFTKYEKIVGLKGEGVNAVDYLVTNYIFPTTTQSIIEGLSKGIGITVSDSYAAYCIIVKLLLPIPKKGVRKFDNNSLTFLNITGNMDIKGLQDNGIINIIRSKKGKENIALVEPDQSAKGELDVISALGQLPDVRKALQGDYNFS